MYQEKRARFCSLTQISLLLRIYAVCVDDWLAQFCILHPIKTRMYKRTFDEVIV